VELYIMKNLCDSEILLVYGGICDKLGDWAVNSTSTEVFYDANKYYLHAMLTSTSGITPTARVYCNSQLRMSLEAYNDVMGCAVGVCSPGEAMKILWFSGGLVGSCYSIFGD
jgi:hypothetical protein